MDSNIDNAPSVEDAIQAFRQAEQWLFTLITDPTGQRYFENKPIEIRMKEFEEQILRMQRFMDFCGNPERDYPSIHVAGTSGKGSVVNLLAGILSASGQRVGYHVSPYLQICNEKLIVDGQMISPSEFASLVAEFRALYQIWAEEDPVFEALKYGEAWVALTFLWFARQEVEWAVIETGLGGRYDPTNVVPSRLAVITNVNYDHVEVLGEDLVLIAGHKAGIIKPGGLAITGEKNPEALEVIRQEAMNKEAELYCLGEDFDYAVDGFGEEAVLSVEGVYQKYEGLRIGMQGGFQLENAALAVASLDLLAGKGELALARENVKEGVSVSFPGRFEVIQSDPIVILDGAHNRHKAKALADSLEVEFPERKMTVVLGTLSIKDFSGIIRALAPLTNEWIATQPKVLGKPAAQASALGDVIRTITPDLPIEEVPDVREAVELALQHAGKDGIVLVTGSLYMLGAVRNRWVSPDELLKSLEQRFQSSRKSTNLR